MGFTTAALDFYEDLADNMTEQVDNTPVRCWGDCGELMNAYHDDEWGKPVREDAKLFERLCLEAFQSGLSWSIILKKRAGFREAFHGFEPRRIAEMTDDDIDCLLQNPSIVRNRRKIEAVIHNATVLVAMQDAGESLVDLVWSHKPVVHTQPRSYEDIPASTEESKALAKALKKRGFSFVGPTTAYATMQAAGLVNDHLVGCETSPAT